MNDIQLISKRLNADLQPQFDFYEKVFEDKPKPITKETDFANIVFEDDIYTRILNNVDKMKEGKWYKIEDKEKVEAVKDMMQAGFLPDITFSDDFTKIRRQDTELLLKLKKDVQKKK